MSSHIEFINVAKEKKIDANGHVICLLGNDRCCIIGHTLLNIRRACFIFCISSRSVLETHKLRAKLQNSNEWQEENSGHFSASFREHSVCILFAKLKTFIELNRFQECQEETNTICISSHYTEIPLGLGRQLQSTVCTLFRKKTNNKIANEIFL